MRRTKGIWVGGSWKFAYEAKTEELVNFMQRHMGLSSAYATVRAELQSREANRLAIANGVLNYFLTRGKA